MLNMGFFPPPLPPVSRLVPDTGPGEPPGPLEGQPLLVPTAPASPTPFPLFPLPFLPFELFRGGAINVLTSAPRSLVNEKGGLYGGCPSGSSSSMPLMPGMRPMWMMRARPTSILRKQKKNPNQVAPGPTQVQTIFLY